MELFAKIDLFMKGFHLILLASCFSCFLANAQLSRSELSNLTPEQRDIYKRQYQDLSHTIKAAEQDIFKAEDIIRIGEEMKRDNAGTAGAAHIMRGMEMKEKALKAKKEAERGLRLLDAAAREAIKNNKSN